MTSTLGFPRPLDRGARRAAAVHGDDQRAARALRAIDVGDLEPVAVEQPVGKDRLGGDATPREHRHQQRGAGDAVDVVVADDGDALAAPARFEQPRHRGLHAVEQERIVEMGGRRLEEAPRGVGVDRASARQQRCVERRHALIDQQRGFRRHRSGKPTVGRGGRGYLSSNTPIER